MRTLSESELNGCYQSLYVYDVEQSGWEQEPLGYEANAMHVITHLGKNLPLKDFNDPWQVESEIAPDSLMYALRLCRWSDLPATELAGEFSEERKVVSRVARRLGGTTLHFAAFTEALGTLSGNLHDHGHDGSRATAVSLESAFALHAGKLLLFSAHLQQDHFGFDLVDTFDARLEELRDKRAGLYDPQTEII